MLAGFATGASTTGSVKVSAGYQVGILFPPPHFCLLSASFCRAGENV
jgi:hypothetical protein